MDLAGWAEGEARLHLSSLGVRWQHSAAVAQRAREIAVAVKPSDRATLVTAAFLHDVGYAAGLAASGFHPLDGARWLLALGHGRLAGLVAHHTAARFEAAALGLADEMDEFPDECSAVSDALTYCDLTTGPTGERTTVARRLDEIKQRYGATSVVSQALEEASSVLCGKVARTESRLARYTVRKSAA